MKPFLFAAQRLAVCIKVQQRAAFPNTKRAAPDKMAAEFLSLAA